MGIDFLPDKVSPNDPLSADAENKLRAEVSRLSKLAGGSNVISNGAGLFPKNSKPIRIIEGILQGALAASTGNGNNEATAEMLVKFVSDGDFSDIGTTVTIVNRDDAYSNDSGKYQMAMSLSGGEWRAVTGGNGTFYHVGAITCDPFDCVYPGYTGGGANCNPSAPAWYVDFGNDLDCTDTYPDIGGIQVLDWVAGCAWVSLVHGHPSIPSEETQWTLTIDNTGTCTLVLMTLATGVTLLSYSKPGDEWCAQCDNLMNGCGSVFPAICTAPPGQVCAKPLESGGSGVPTTCCPVDLVANNLTLQIPPLTPNCYGLDGQTITLTHVASSSPPEWQATGTAGAGTYFFSLKCVGTNWTLHYSATEPTCDDLSLDGNLTSADCNTFGLLFQFSSAGLPCCYDSTHVFTVQIF